MTKIRTAEEIFTEIAGVTTICSKETAIQIAIEYAKQFIDLAAEEAREYPVSLPELGALVSKESILKLKERVV